jgi:tRNA-2-methylthio-N6-dimethylallyladenosine synthase
LLRIRFTTSHPMDLSSALVRCFREVPQLMPHFHLPVQHGADTVLQRMRRKYTIAEYEERIAALPSGLALTSDIICGFPGETEEEHRQNLGFLRRTPYDNLFSFLYSPRPHTGAILKLQEWGEVPRDIALRRLEEVQRLQMDRTLQRRRAAVGAVVEVLVENEGFGRSRENWTVHFAGDARTGDLVRVRVESASLVALRGVQAEILDRAPAQHRQPQRRLTVVSA